AVAHVKGRSEAQARDGSLLVNALDIDVRGVPPSPGAPLVDGSGSVVGLLVRACRPLSGNAAGAGGGGAGSQPPPPPVAGTTSPCSPAFFGAPIAVIRSFLLKTPLNAVTPSPWLGIVG